MEGEKGDDRGWERKIRRIYIGGAEETEDIYKWSGGTCSVRQVGYCNLRSGWSKGQGGIDQRSGGMIDHIRREREGGEGSNCVNNSIQFRRG